MIVNYFEVDKIIMFSQKVSNVVPHIEIIDQRFQTNNTEFNHPISICSCSICDSNSCFKLRNEKSALSCFCQNCGPSKHCLGSSELLVQPESKKNKPIPTQEKKQEIKQQLEKDKEIAKEQTTSDKVIDKSKQIEKKKTKEQKTEPEIEQKKVQLEERVQLEREKVKDKGQNKKLLNVEQINKERYHECTKNKNSEIDLRKSIIYKYRDTTHVNKNKKYYEQSLTEIQRVAITIAKKQQEKSKAELSAQIMNVPYEEFKNSLSLSNTKRDAPPFNKINLKEIIKPDILSKLKEIYNACSCKVCECITGKSPQCTTGTTLPSVGMCKCKPCECIDCKDTTILDTDNEQHPHPGCPCVSCDRKDCRGVVKTAEDTKYCECKPCACAKYTVPTKPCTCEPCKCVECTVPTRGPKQFILAHVQGHFGQNVCQCEPCKCLHCNYTEMANRNLRREMSTNISYKNCQCDNCLNDVCQFDRELCGCDQNRVMRKPVQTDSHDYNIHTAFIDEQHTSASSKYKYNNKHNTIAMCALSENYSNTVFNSKNIFFKSNHCQCQECVCVICKANEKLKTNNKRKRKSLSQNISNAFTNLRDSCHCLLCECHVCAINRYNQRNLLDIKGFQSSCGCNICDCIICKGLNCNINFINKKNTVETTSSTKDEVSRYISSDNIVPFKKGNILTPSLFEAKISLPSGIKTPSYPSNQKLKGQATEKKVFLKIISKEVSSRKICHQKLPEYHTILKQTSSNGEDNYSLTPDKDPTLPDTEIVSNNKLSGEVFTNESNNNIKFIKTIKNSNISILKHNVSNMNIRKPLKDIGFKKSFNVSKNPSKTNIIFSNYIKDLDCLHDSEQKNRIEIQNINQVDGVESEDNDKNDSSKKDHLINNSSILSIYKSSSNSLKVFNKICKLSINKVTNNHNTSNTFEKANLIESNISLHLLKSTDDITKSNKLKPLKDIYDYNVITVLEKLRKNDTKHSRELINDNLSKINTRNNYIMYRTKYSKMHSRIIKRKPVRKLNKMNKPMNNSTVTILNNDINNEDDAIKGNLEQTNQNNVNLLSHDIVTYIKDFFVSELNLLKKIKMEVQDININHLNNPLPILRKNQYLNSEEVRQNKSAWTIPDLDFDLKPALKSISLQASDIKSYLALKNMHDNATLQTFTRTIQVEKETNCNLFESLENFNSCIRCVLNTVLIQAVDETEESRMMKLSLVDNLEWEMPKVNSASRCLGLKANFAGLRRISDHTVLVRWMIPQKITYVQGYELQVDGRSIQKILSPKRNTAILTCLPNSDKLLLTIRTITTSDMVSDHYPATTIVYRPRVK